jgi:hypothetical protein
LELLLEADKIITNVSTPQDIDLENIILGEIELEKKRVKNIREKTALLIELIDHHTEVYYGFPPRPKFEVLGGYKIAEKRGAILNNIKVFNLYFRFKNQKLDGTSTAMMYRDSSKNEFILLLPDDTEKTFISEKRFYLDYAKKLVFDSSMNPDYQSFLIENLNLLNRRERCAQSILHEYGHILHYRCFDLLKLKNPKDQLIWFKEWGYLDLLDLRYPGLGYLDPNTFFYHVKEAFVEDVRIGLNFNQKNDIFILPNAVTFVRDFQNYELLIEGVNIVKKMINQVQRSRVTPDSPSFGNEPSRIRLGSDMVSRQQKYSSFERSLTDSRFAALLDAFESENEQTQHLVML